MVEPGLLDLRARRSPANRFDRRDLRRADAVDRGDARTRRGTADVHGAGAAQRHATTEFRPRLAEHVV